MSETQFEPEVLALLDEIARSPEGRLLHVPRERLRSYYGDPSETLTPHGSFLSRAERHLVSAYREQAAQVLLEACILGLKRDPQFFTTLKRDIGELRDKARCLDAVRIGEGNPARTLVALASGEDLSLTELAIASVRLDPCDRAHNILAVCYQQEGWFNSSLKALERFRRGAASQLQRAQAFANMAHVFARLLDFPEAVRLGLKACALEETRSRFPAWSLTSAVQGGDEPSALESMRLLEERTDASDFTPIVDGLRTGRANGAWAPTSASVDLLPRIRHKCSSRAGAILDVLA
jgi:hypothetical protein